jgi:predicted glycoside hydrolase/deacetylase ChbG (UPF0249 family)
VLIVNADDLGLAPAVNAGIFDALDAGLVSDASLLVTGTAVEHAVAGLAARGRCSTGLHLCLVDGERPAAPPARVEPLLRQGRFLERNQLFRRIASARAAVLAAVATEVDAQFERARSLGLEITHVDSHQHVHLFPGIVDVVIAACRNHGVRVLRAPVTRIHSIGSASVATLSRRMRRRAQAAGVSPFPSLGFECSGRMTAEAFQRYVTQARRLGAEVMVHPGRGNSHELPAYAHWGYDWDRELQALRTGAGHDPLGAISYAEALQTLG